MLLIEQSEFFLLVLREALADFGCRFEEAMAARDRTEAL
jgi:hypothetical protein